MSYSDSIDRTKIIIKRLYKQKEWLENYPKCGEYHTKRILKSIEDIPFYEEQLKEFERCSKMKMDWSWIDVTTMMGICHMANLCCFTVLNTDGPKQYKTEQCKCSETRSINSVR